MLLYSDILTPRLAYIINFVSNQLLQDSITITNDRNYFFSQTGPKINYSETRINSDEFFIKPVSLLFENNIIEQPVVVKENNGLKYFFDIPESDYAFDLFAASFYLLSRYEEYLPHTPDEYGRYCHTNSIAYKAGFLHDPLINYWLIDFKNALHKRFPSLQFAQQTFKLIPTYDIDNAWKYQSKGFVRTIGSFLKYVATGQYSQLRERFAVLLHKQPDPFDAYDRLHELHQKHTLHPYYFFLLAEKQTGYDKNIHPSKKQLQQLIQAHLGQATIGIHPSWQSGDKHKLLQKEINLLASITQQPVKCSRQHYIRFTLPDTFRRLIDAGIEKDFSMGYGGINGFRASVASSYYWFDVEKNEPTQLRLYPFCFMEATCLYEEKISPSAAFEQLMLYYEKIKEVNGLMITLWHNQAFGTDALYKGWKEVYENFLELLKH